MGIKPEDILADNQNYALLDGVKIRKGTIGAALANAEVLISPTASHCEKESAKQALKATAQLLKNTSFARYLMWRDAEIQTIFDESAV